MAQIKLLGKTNIQGKTIFATNTTPTYNITRSASSVDEGSSITFTLSTTNVANGTSLPYTISGISANDVTSGSLTGNFTVNSGTATATITMSADQLTEGAETATLTLNNGAASNFVVVNDTSVFAPTQISGLQLWLDASDSSTLYNATAGGSLVTTDGSAVARWQDKSGNNRHATQATANARPLLKTNIKNNRNILRFDGSNDSLAVNSVASFFTNSHTIFAVGALSGTSPGALIGAVGWHQTIRLHTTSATTEVHDPYAGSSVAYTRGAWGVFTRRLASSSPNTLQIFKNGNAGNLISRSATMIRSVSNVNIGAADPGDLFGYAWHLNGDISEILIYNSALTTTQRQNVETYLNAKWALY